MLVGVYLVCVSGVHWYVLVLLCCVATPPPRPQVQLLVSKKEVETYRRIKKYLEKLKSLVEEAELWVRKTGDSGRGHHVSMHLKQLKVNSR